MDKVFVPRYATDSQLLEIVGNWIDLLAKQEYEIVASALGYAVAYGEPPADCIRREIRQYRSSTFFPGVDDFRVTEKAQAVGGNPQPRKIVTRYKPNSTRLWAAIDYDLPLNGKWSDLCANFVIFETNEADPRLVLSLERLGHQTPFAWARSRTSERPPPPKSRPSRKGIKSGPSRIQPVSHFAVVRVLKANNLPLRTT